MTDVELIQPSPSSRLADIQGRLQTRRTGTTDGPGFEALLAEAMERQQRSDRSSSSTMLRRGGAPAGALGAGNRITPGSVGVSATGLGPLGRSSGQAVVDAGMKHLGVPYLWGGTDAEHGFDCSGLVQDAYAQIGVEMPKWSRHQATMGAEIDSIEKALPGDVLAFGEPVSHVALYVGDGQMLHAPRTGEVVKIEAIDRPIKSIRRIVAPASSGSRLALSAPTSFETPGQAERSYRPLFAEAGARWGIDPALLAAVAQTESGFDSMAVSPAGAQGLMQFMPATAAEMGVDPWDSASAIDGAARYLRTSIDQFGSVELAIASYNAGRGAVSRFGGVPPYAETVNYVDRVTDAWRSRS